MTTREEQIEKAQTFALLNPEWMQFPLSPRNFVRRGDGAWIRGTLGGRWQAYQTAGYQYPLRTKALSIRSFASPFAAARALGFVVKEEG